MAVELLLCVLAAGFVGEPSRADDEVTAEQFLRLINSQQSGIADVAFAFEGEIQRLVRADESDMPEVVAFQGRYALRSDGAMFEEVVYDVVEPRVTHTIETMINGKGESAQITPDWEADPDPPIMKIAAGPGTFNAPVSPERFQFRWRLQSLKGVSDFRYKFLGWDVIDGHRCAHIDFHAHPNAVGPVRQELWVDLARGAHPLQIRNTHGADIVYQARNIRLDSFALPSGESVWFPVSGQFEVYHHKGRYTKEPAFRIICYVLKDTILFNQGLGDGVFHVKGDPFRPSFQPKSAVARVQNVTKKRPVVDFAEAEKKLDDTLSQPERQKQINDAQKSAQAEMASASVLPWALGVGGAAVLSIAVWLIVRGRAAGAE